MIVFAGKGVFDYVEGIPIVCAVLHLREDCREDFSIVALSPFKYDPNYSVPSLSEKRFGDEVDELEWKPFRQKDGTYAVPVYFDCKDGEESVKEALERFELVGVGYLMTPENLEPVDVVIPEHFRKYMVKEDQIDYL